MSKTLVGSFDYDERDPRSIARASKSAHELAASLARNGKMTQVTDEKTSSNIGSINVYQEEN